MDEVNLIHSYIRSLEDRIDILTKTIKQVNSEIDKKDHEVYLQHLWIQKELMDAISLSNQIMWDEDQRRRSKHRKLSE
jgi:hypothetical protein